MLRIIFKQELQTDIETRRLTKKSNGNCVRTVVVTARVSSHQPLLAITKNRINQRRRLNRFRRFPMDVIIAHVRLAREHLAIATRVRRTRAYVSINGGVRVSFMKYLLVAVDF